MKRHGNLDLAGNVKIRGVIVDETTTQGGFYSQQFGETAYKSDISGSSDTASNLGGGAGVFSSKVGADFQFKSLTAGSNITLTPSGTEISIASSGGGSGGGGGFYGILIRETDGHPPTFLNDTIIFDSDAFYLHGNSVGKPVVSLRFDLGAASHKHEQATPAAEWIVNHNLGGVPVLVQAFNTKNKMIGFDEVDVGDPNVAYFYFTQPIAGRAMVVARMSGQGLDVTDGIHSVTDATELNFNNRNFYISQKGSSQPVANWELNEGFHELEVKLTSSKNVNWNWNDGNAFVLPLQHNAIIHTPSGILGKGRAQQVILVTKQPSSGFYNVTFSKAFMFSGGDQPQPTEDPNSVDLWSFHYSPFIGKILGTQLAEMFY